jgi:hypothetical protein
MFSERGFKQNAGYGFSFPTQNDTQTNQNTEHRQKKELVIQFGNVRGAEAEVVGFQVVEICQQDCISMC